MVWTQEQLVGMAVMRRVYRQWIANIGSGNDEHLATQRVMGVLVDDRAAALACFEENADEIDGILEAADFREG
jgi:hypothetical protein